MLKNGHYNSRATRIARQGMLLGLAACATICIVGQSSSEAGTLTSTFAVSATISGTAACTSISATAMSFGSVAASGTGTATSTLTVNCSTNAPYSITAVGAVPGCLGATLINVMGASPTSNPGYTLFKDAAHTLPLAPAATNPCTGSTATALTGTGTGAAQTQTLYGQLSGTIQGNTATAPGNYTDTATITMTF